MKIQIEIPDELHPTNQKLIIEFAQAMAEKLRQGEIKRGALLWLGWSPSEMIQAIRHHIGKGDFRDVANIAAFLWWKTQRKGEN